MDSFVALVSTHGVLQEVRSFADEAAARSFAQAVVSDKGFKLKDSGDKTWLENWGDEDGCGVIVAGCIVE